MKCRRCGCFTTTRPVWVGFGRFIRVQHCNPCAAFKRVTRSYAIAESNARKLVGKWRKR